MPPVFAHGRLRLYLLTLLAEAPRHGYEVIRLLEERFQGLYAPSAGTVYPRLAKLEAEGLVSHTSDGGRKTYAITQAGCTELTERQPELTELELEIQDALSALAEEAREGATLQSDTARHPRHDTARHPRHEGTGSASAHPGSTSTHPGSKGGQSSPVDADVLSGPAARLVPAGLVPSPHGPLPHGTAHPDRSGPRAPSAVSTTGPEAARSAYAEPHEGAGAGGDSAGPYGSGRGESADAAGDTGDTGVPESRSGESTGSAAGRRGSAPSAGGGAQHPESAAPAGATGDEPAGGAEHAHFDAGDEPPSLAEELRFAKEQWKEHARKARQESQQAKRQARKEREAHAEALEEVRRIARQVQDQVRTHFRSGDGRQGTAHEGISQLAHGMGDLGRITGYTTPWAPYVRPDRAAPEEPGSDDWRGYAERSETAGEYGDPERDLLRLLDRFRDDVRDAARDNGVTERQLRAIRRELSTAAAHVAAMLGAPEQYFASDDPHDPDRAYDAGPAEDADGPGSAGHADGPRRPDGPERSEGPPRSDRQRPGGSLH